MRALRAATTLALTALMVSVPTAAAADPDRIELSLDGRSWASTLGGPLFGEAPVLVPLDSVNGSFYVRNASNVPAAASIEVVRPEAPSELDQHLRVTWGLGDVESAGTVGTIVRGRCTTTITGRALLPGEWQRVDVELGLPDLDGRTAQGAATDLSMLVRLTQARTPGAVKVCGSEAARPEGPSGGPSGERPPGPAAGDRCAGSEVVLVGTGRAGCDDEVAGVTGSRLPGTGSPAGLRERLLLGLGAVGTGALLMAVRRRGARSED